MPDRNSERPVPSLVELLAPFSKRNHGSCMVAEVRRRFLPACRQLPVKVATLTTVTGELLFVCAKSYLILTASRTDIPVCPGGTIQAGRNKRFSIRHFQFLVCPHFIPDPFRHRACVALPKTGQAGMPVLLTASFSSHPCHRHSLRKWHSGDTHP